MTGLLMLVAFLAGPPGEMNRTRPGELRIHATERSIGIEWDLAGDANRNAACRVRYRPKGARAWREPLPLFRIDFHSWYSKWKAARVCNMLAGSILFLDPGTAYEVELMLSDPDGGREMRRADVATRRTPEAWVRGRLWHVAPGSGGGDGTKERPFLGLKAAEQVTMPGDICLLGAGDYGTHRFTKSGKDGRLLAYRATGKVTLGGAVIQAGHVLLEGLAFEGRKVGTGLTARGAVAGVAVRHCSFRGFRDSIVLNRECKDWHIGDNDIVGINDPTRADLEGEGIDLAASDGHVVAHNRVSRVQAGVHYARRNCDIHGNDIFDTTDDGIETDYGQANLRIWGNRITNYRHSALSFQPMACGPWYIVRNQVVGKAQAFKFRVQDRFLLAHNTFVTWEPPSHRMHHILYSLSRNNLYISASGTGPAWVAFDYAGEDAAHVRPTQFKPNWMTDVDHDGFDWGTSKEAFRWDDGKLTLYPDLASFSKAVGIEKNGIRVRKEDIFLDYRLPAEYRRVEPPVLILRKGCNAIDAGARLPNINDGFSGKAPDLGAHEASTPHPAFGPRRRK